MVWDLHLLAPTSIPDRVEVQGPPSSSNFGTRHRPSGGPVEALRGDPRGGRSANQGRAAIPGAIHPIYEKIYLY